MAKHTPGKWVWVSVEGGWDGVAEAANRNSVICVLKLNNPENARLIAAAPTQHEEMVRFLPIIERAESDPELWTRLTAGTGIATANGYRAAIAKATEA